MWVLLMLWRGGGVPQERGRHTACRAEQKGPRRWDFLGPREADSDTSA